MVASILYSICCIRGRNPLLYGLSGTSISATTFYGNGSNLTNIDHNTTINKQGGQSNQYYHLTQAEYALVSGSSLDDRYVNVTGDTINGLLKSTSLSATSISATTYYGNGSNITGIVEQINGKFIHLSGDTMTGQLKSPNLSATTITRLTLQPTKTGSLSTRSTRAAIRPLSAFS
jgi:hypothetical protein